MGKNSAIETGVKDVGSVVTVDPINPGDAPAGPSGIAPAEARNAGSDAAAVVLTTTPTTIPAPADVTAVPSAAIAPAQSAATVAPGATAQATAPASVPVTTADAAPETAEKTDELPDNKWTRYYYDLKDRADKNPNLKGPLTDMMLSLLLLASKYSHYADMVPGRFRKSLDEDEDLKDKKLNKAQITQVENGKGMEKASNLKRLKDLAATQESAGRKLGIERASTKFACNSLWGFTEGGDNTDKFEGIDNAASLAASLLHTGKKTAGESVPLYLDSSIENLRNKPAIEKGTIIIFIPKMESGEKVVAYADGELREGKSLFKYYDPSKKDGEEIVEFTLNDSSSPVKSGMGVVSVLIPNITKYKSAVEEVNPATPEAADKPVENPEEKPKMPGPEEQLKLLQGTTETIKAGVEGVDLVIKNLDENPSTIAELNIPGKIEETEAGEKLATETISTKVLAIKQSARNVTEVKASEAALKVIAEAEDASEEDKTNYAAAVAKTAEAEKLKTAIESTFSELELLLGKIKEQAAYFKNLKIPEAK